MGGRRGGIPGRLAMFLPAANANRRASHTKKQKQRENREVHNKSARQTDLALVAAAATFEAGTHSFIHLWKKKRKIH